MRSRILSIGLLGFMVSQAIAMPTIAQPLPDDSLGAQSSVVVDGFVDGLPARLIEGGAQRLQNLFHSFQDFSIDVGQRVYFNPTEEVSAIFSRVTGNLPSNINGTLGIEGAADLYFINQNGIAFGAGSSLDITGSLFATTSDRITFKDGYEYSSAPSFNSDVLTISTPLGLQTTDIPSQGRIENEGFLLLNPLQSIMLQGNSLYNSGIIGAPGGNITLLAEDIAITATALLNTSAIGQGDSGDIIVRASDATYFAGQAIAQGGFLSGNGGAIVISGVEDLIYQGTADTQAVAGDPGSLLLDTANIEIVEARDNINSLDDVFNVSALNDGIARIAANDLLLIPTSLGFQAEKNITVNADILLGIESELNAAAGGDITLNRSIQSFNSDVRLGAGNDILIKGAAAFIITFGGDAELTGENAISILEGAQVNTSSLIGNSGDVSIGSQQLVIAEEARIDTSSLTGNGGSVKIDTHSLELEDNSAIFTLGSRRSGDINISASGEIEISGGSSLFGDTFVSDQNISSRGADVTINAATLSISESSFISNAAIGTGQSGNITITTTELVSVDSKGFINTGATSESGAGDSGDITVRSPQVILDDAFIAASSLNRGNAGSVLLEADNLTIRNGGEVGARAILEDSSAGDIVVKAQTIVLEDGGSIETAAPSSNGGNIDLTADRYILLRRGSFISAEAGTAEASDLLNPTEGLGTGGNVTIRTPFLIAPTTENSNISANAFVGDGGRVNISATGIFGIEFREARSLNSDITASSEFGADGIVTLNAPDTSFVEDNIAALSDAPVNDSQLIAQSCIARARDGQGSFVVSGADGLRQRPGSNGVTAFSTGRVRAGQSLATTLEPVWQPGDPIIEPSGVFELSQGQPVLGRDCSN